MMVNCPRCGFSQEKDQYCAQCGVDMIAFQPTPKPLWFRMLNNLTVQLLALGILVITVFLIARQLHHREVAERIRELASSTSTRVISRRTADDSRSALATDSAVTSTDATSAESQDPRSPPPPAQPTPMSVNEAVASDTSQTDDSKNSAVHAVTSARLIFASIGRTALADLVASADPRSLSNQGPIVSGILSNFASHLKAVQSSDYWSILDQTTRPIKLNQLVEFYGGQREETLGQFFGFVLELTPTQLDDNGDSHIQVRGWRYLHDNGPSAEEFSIPLPENMVIPHGGGAFISGTLPKRQLSEAERHFYDALKVVGLLSNDDYRSGNSDLVIFIEAK